jgi:hypothetical protein
MPIRRSADATLDLFSAQPPANAPEPPTTPQERAADDRAQPRQILPKDLAVALKQLDDREINALLSAVTEAERRGRLSAQPRPKGKFAADARAQTRQRPVGDGAGSMTTGKLNAVRAAFKAGVKPSAIARQFGISQTDVRTALATEGRDRQSGR